MPYGSTKSGIASINFNDPISTVEDQSLSLNCTNP